MKLREKTIILSLLLISMMSVASSGPSYGARFRGIAGDYARRAAAPTTASWLARRQVLARPIDLDRAQADLDRLREEETVALAKMRAADDLAALKRTPEAYRAADAAAAVSRAAGLALLEKEELVAGAKVNNAQMDLLRAQQEGEEDITKLRKEAFDARLEYDTVKKLRRGFEEYSQAEDARAAAREEPSLWSRFSKWWSAREIQQGFARNSWDTAGQTIRERQRAAEARQAAEALQRERWNPAGY